MFLLASPSLTAQAEPEVDWRGGVYIELNGLLSSGSNEQAFTLAEESLERLPADDPFGPYFRLQLGYACLALGRIQEGYDVVEAQLAGSVSTYFQCWAHIVRSRLHLAIGRPDLARASTRAALALESGLDVSQRHDAGALHEARLCALRVELAIGEREGPLAQIDEYLKSDLYLGKDNALGDLHYDRGLVLEQCALDAEDDPSREQRFEQAESAYAAAVGHYREDLGEDTGVSGELAVACVALARIQLQRENSAGVEALLQRARAYAGEAPSIRTRELLSTAEARLALATGAPRERLLEILERMEAALADSTERWLGQRLPEEGSGVLLYRSSRTLISEYTRIALGLFGVEEGAERALERVLAFQGLSTLARETGSPAVTLAELRSTWLPKDGGLILFVPAAVRSQVFAIDHEGVVNAELEGIHELERVSSRHGSLLRRDLGDDPSRRKALLEAEVTSAKALGQAFFPPAFQARLKKWESLSVAGLESLGHVPLAAAIPPGSEVRVGLRYAFDSPASLPLSVARSRSAPALAPQSVLLVGGVDPDARVRKRWPSVTPLALPSEVVAPILGAYPEDRTRLLRAREASLESLREIDLGEYDVLQFLVHGVFDTTRLVPPGLVLAASKNHDGVLFADQVMTLPTSPRAVFLTACRSGRGALRVGDAHSADQAGAWLRRGARAVLVVHSDVSYGDARDLSVLVHRRLASGAASLAEALRDARAEVAASDEAWPFRFGLYEVLGLGHEPFGAPEPQEK